MLSIRKLRLRERKERLKLSYQIAIPFPAATAFYQHTTFLSQGPRVTQPRLEEGPEKINSHPFPGLQAPFPKYKTSLSQPQPLKYLAAEIPGNSQQLQQLRGGPDRWGQGAQLPYPIVKPLTLYLSPGHVSCCSLVLLLVTWKCSPGSGSQDFPNLQLFSGPRGRWEDWPSVQAHFPDPGFPLLPRDLEWKSLTFWEQFFFFTWPGRSENYM